MKLYKILCHSLLGLAALLCFPTIAQSFDTGSYDIRRIDSSYGLGYSWVSSISGSSDGYIWFSTIYGTYRYDGYSCEPFLFTADDGTNAGVNFTTETSDGAIWFGTANCGLVRMDPITMQRETLVGGYVNCMVQSRDGSLWVGTMDGLYRMHKDENAFAALESIGQPILSICELSNGEIYAGGTDGVLYKFSGQGHDNVTDERYDSEITVIKEDPRGRVWLGFSSDGALLLDSDGGGNLL
ncbi:MAG: hypothetical protein NC115_08975 [Bacteroidales bacterium]|nr:hypothetical protein [Bacteroidales bacterium]